MRKIFFDTETTGLKPGNICQLSAIILDDDNNIQVKNYFFEVEYITRGAEEVCGRGVEFYKEASQGKQFKDYADELFNLFSNALLIAHNIKFDENFLSTEFWRLNKIFKPLDRFDTMTYFKDICKLPGKYNNTYKNPKLEELVNFLNLDEQKIQKYTNQLFGLDGTELTGFHDARYDTTSMFVAFQVYGEMLSGKNQWIQSFIKGE